MDLTSPLGDTNKEESVGTISTILMKQKKTLEANQEQVKISKLSYEKIFVKFENVHIITLEIIWEKGMELDLTRKEQFNKIYKILKEISIFIIRKVLI